MKRTLLFLAMMISMQASAQTDYNKTIDGENNAVVMNGVLDFDVLRAEPGFSWFGKGAEDYKPDEAAIAVLQGRLTQYQLVAVLGTWCEDSQVLIPRLYKTLTLADYPTKQVRIIGVDRQKEGKNGEHKPYNVTRVPTIIVFRDKEEVGRIVETATESIEKDLVKIVLQSQ